jgi:hypothetical protein
LRPCSLDQTVQETPCRFLVTVLTQHKIEALSLWARIASERRGFRPGTATGVVANCRNGYVSTKRMYPSPCHSGYRNHSK